MSAACCCPSALWYTCCSASPRWGWGFDKYLAEANRGQGLKFSPKLKPYFQWVLPILIVIILVQGLF